MAKPPAILVYNTSHFFGRHSKHPDCLKMCVWTEWLANKELNHMHREKINGTKLLPVDSSFFNSHNAGSATELYYKCVALLALPSPVIHMHQSYMYPGCPVKEMQHMHLLQFSQNRCWSASRSTCLFSAYERSQCLCQFDLMLTKVCCTHLLHSYSWGIPLAWATSTLQSMLCVMI